MRIGFGWGTLLHDSDWPDATAFHPEPPGLDELAKKHRLEYYLRIDTLLDAQRALAFIGPVVQIAVPVTHRWYESSDGYIARRISDDPVIGPHAISLVDYSRPKKAFRFANTWGVEWGREGHGVFTFEAFRKDVTEAWGGSMGFARFPQGRGQTVTRSIVKTPLGFLHLIEARDFDADERAGWALIRETPDCFDLQDLFVKPAYRRRGLATTLAREVRSVTGYSKMKPLRAYVYAVDAAKSPRSAIDKLAALLGFTLTKSPFPWARLVAAA